MDVAELVEVVENSSNLPSTVSLLRLANGSSVYIVGTAHFSLESQHDVMKTISTVRPDIIVVELCPSRAHILHIDKETLLEEAKTINMARIQAACRQNGLFNGLMYIMMLKTNASITRQLGMAPGGEFRVAYIEATKLPNCIFHLGDRPLSITLQRAMISLTWWQTVKLIYSLILCPTPISKEEVEVYKNHDVLDKMLLELGQEYPEMGRVFLHERDLFLTHSLQIAAMPQVIGPNGETKPVTVVGVVGIGHVSGIKNHFGTVTDEDLRSVMDIPAPTRMTILTKKGFKLCALGLVGFLIYKATPNSIKNVLLNSPQKLIQLLKQ